MLRHVAFIAAVCAVMGLAIADAWAEPPAPNAGTITISIKEYEEMKEAVEGDERDQYWKMTFAQILDKKSNDAEKAWELYEYYVLRTIRLDGTVQSSTVNELINELHVLAEIDAEKPVTMVLSSGGGSVFDGLRLYNAMMAAPMPVNTVCDGLAMSMAAVLLSAGDHRTAKPGCMFMIHEMAGGAPGGQTTQQLKTADVYVSLENELWRILSENSGYSVPDLLTLAEFETWWSAEEARALGFVDEVSGKKPRELVAGSRAIPEDMEPRARFTRHMTERMR